MKNIKKWNIKEVWELPQKCLLHWSQVMNSCTCVVKWGNDGTKITNLSVMFHWDGSFITMWHYYITQTQTFIDDFSMPSSVYACTGRCTWEITKKLSSTITPLIGEMLGHTNAKVGTSPNFTPWCMVFVG